MAETERAKSDEENNSRVVSALEPEKRRLLAYIRKRIPREVDAEDLLQDVFIELIEAYRLMKPIAHAGAWMMQVAKNRITDLFRRSPRELPLEVEGKLLEDWLPSSEGGPDAVFARQVLLDEIESALEELPPAQREVFIAHEIEGRSFAGLAAETGVGINTLLSRKHYAVQRLRSRLQRVYSEFTNDTGYKSIA